MRTSTEIVCLTVNGYRREVGVPTHFTLLETLRYVIGLTGSKQGCDKGDCRAFTVILDGEPTLSCITPVWEAEGRAVTTVEGLSLPRGATSATGRFRPERCRPMRLLHARDPVLCSRASRAFAGSHTRADQGGVGGKSLPLHGIYQDLSRRGGRCCRTPQWCVRRRVFW
jgi:hypothetical protein